MSDRRFAKQIQIQNCVKCTRRTSTLNVDSNSDSHPKVKYTILIVYDMAQSATQKRTQFGKELFWEKPSADPQHPVFPRELSENCELGSQEDTLIRDLFNANMQDPEIQKMLLRETLEPPQVLLLAINKELGQRNQIQISNTQPAAHVNAISPQRPFRHSNQRPSTLNST